MTRTERRQLERQQAKMNKKNDTKKLFIDVATTLQQAITSAERANAGSFQFNKKLYLRNPFGWKEYDVLSELLTFPQYKEIYNDVLLSSDGDEEVAANIVLTVFTTNL
jgi:hypothetical protein